MSPQISDLDRCEHGRHVIDQCFDCRGSNAGNPHLDQVIGYVVRGEPFTVRDLLHSLDPERAARFVAAGSAASEEEQR